MTITEFFQIEETVPVAVLEELVRQRVRWADAIVSPFALAARNSARVNEGPSSSAPRQRRTGVPEDDRAVA
jgi:hypothetical protein